MLFYDSIGPNPKVVRVFMAERGISGIPTEAIDLRGGENRQEPFLSKNPSGQCPALALDNGTVLAEITAICEYLDEIGPGGTTLIGSTPEERAETRMWVRRIDLNILEPMANGFRFSDGLGVDSTVVSPAAKLVSRLAGGSPCRAQSAHTD